MKSIIAPVNENKRHPIISRFLKVLAINGGKVMGYKRDESLDKHFCYLALADCTVQRKNIISKGKPR